MKQKYIFIFEKIAYWKVSLEEFTFRLKCEIVLQKLLSLLIPSLNLAFLYAYQIYNHF